MKKLLLSLLFCIPVFAQTGFKAEANEIIWEGVFNQENANVVTLLDRDPNLKVTTFIDNTYKGKADDVQNTCNGGTGLMKNKVKFEFVVIQDPEGYVVRVSKLKIIEKFGPLQSKTVANRCEKYFLIDNTLNPEPNATENMACLDRFFTGLFGTQPSAGETAITSN